jgi:predicted homoserine dehydrogenase-like protein
LAASAQTPASERVRVGVIGAGVRGPYVASGMALHPACSIVGVCDVYKPNAQKAAQSLSVRLRHWRPCITKTGFLRSTPSAPGLALTPRISLTA